VVHGLGTKQMVAGGGAASGRPLRLGLAGGGCDLATRRWCRGAEGAMEEPQTRRGGARQAGGGRGVKRQ
jgi:hypothetical protein